MKNNNKRFIIAMHCEDNSKSILDVLIHRNGKPMYFKNSNKAKNFLKNMYNNNKLNLKPFEDDGVLLMSVQ